MSNYLETYRDGLLHDTLPFWLPRCLDREYGGYMTALDRDGTIMDTDKAVWVQGRFAWLLSSLYADVERRAPWLEAAKLGIDFIRRHCFDTDGRMFFQVTREGRPLRKRRYVFSEMFAITALAAYARASGEARAAEEALDLFKKVECWLATPGFFPTKVNPEVRPSKGLVMPMIRIITAQVLRQTVSDPICDDVIQWSIEEIRRDFMKPEHKAVLEVVAPDGSVIDHLAERTLNPGHAIEAAWFIMDEARHRGGDRELIEMGTTILDWMWDWGWDQEYGGILYFRDLRGFCSQEYWQDMKFWWPHNETIIATLMAYQLTNDKRYAAMHRQVHDWSYAHFPDREHGEWFGYLHRDGSVANPAKGNMWKGPFHLPRMQLVCWKLMEQMSAANAR